MENNGNSVGKKIQKNPFLLGLLVVVVTVALFAISTLSTAIQDRVREKENETTKPTETTASVLEDVTMPENSIETGEMKKYAEGIETVVCQKEANRVAVTVTFESEDSLLNAHFANNIGEISVVPIFCFYVDNSTKQIKCPGEIRLLSDGLGVVYYLSEFSDYANAAGLSDEITVTLDNLLTNKFNLSIEHKTNDDVFRTVLGTNGQSVEQFNSLYANKPAKISEADKGIKKVETTLTDEFVWVDIYFTNVDSFTELNNNFNSNFVNFKLEKGGKFYERDFLVSEHESLNMIRCKFDSYSLESLAKEMGLSGELTVKELFTDYKIYIWTSDYETKTDLFVLN